MYEVIGKEVINRPASYNRREVKGIRIHCLDYSVEIAEGNAVVKFFFPDRENGKNRAKAIKLGDVLETVYYDAEKFPIGFEIAETKSDA